MTAVEWLQDKWSNCKEWKWEEIEQWFEQAKEMEKQQIIDANYDGQRLHSKSCTKQMLQDNAESYFTETYGSKGSDDTTNITHWVGVIKWNDGTTLTTEPFYQYQDIKLWSSKFSYENTGKFESIDYKKIDGKGYTYSEALKNEERINNSKIIKETTSSQPEISDEEIENRACLHYGSFHDFIDGAKWYREQLKQR